MPSGFRMGEHQFYAPGEPAPLDRGDAVNKRPIRGAIPPVWLKRIADEADPSGPGRFLADGEFCGHGEPTFGVFDVVLDGQSELELAFLESESRMRVLARPARACGTWTLLHDSNWFEYSGGQPNLPSGRCVGDHPAAAPFQTTSGETARFKVAVGFEYPCECTSESDVSWIAVAVDCVNDAQAGVCFSAETG